MPSVLQTIDDLDRTWTELYESILSCYAAARAGLPCPPDFRSRRPPREIVASMGHRWSWLAGECPKLEEMGLLSDLEGMASVEQMFSTLDERALFSECPTAFLTEAIVHDPAAFDPRLGSPRTKFVVLPDGQLLQPTSWLQGTEEIEQRLKSHVDNLARETESGEKSEAWWEEEHDRPTAYWRQHVADGFVNLRATAKVLVGAEAAEAGPQLLRPDGPGEAYTFWWKGSPLLLGNTKNWKLLKVIWQRDYVEFLEAATRVWGSEDAKPATIRNRVYRLTDAMLHSELIDPPQWRTDSEIIWPVS